MHLIALLSVSIALGACTTPPDIQLTPCREMPRGYCSYTDTLDESQRQ